VQPLAATAEHRCLWARQRGLPEAAALCANASATVAAPVQLTLDLGVAVR
jgi:hypothetical protein